MTKRLAAVMDLRPGEGLLFVWFFAFSVFWGVAVALGGASGEALFLKRWGVSRLPIFFIVADVSVMAGAWLYGRMVHQVKTLVLFRIILGTYVTIATTLALAAAIGGAPLDGVVLPLLVYWSFYVFVELGWMHFFSFQRRYLDLQQGKRLLPRILGGYSLGIVLGGFGVTVVMRAGSAAGVLVCWAISVGLSLVALEGLGRGVPPLATAAVARRRSRPQSLRSYPLALWILGFTVLSCCAMRVVELQANAVFTTTYSSSETLATFYGGFAAVSRLLGIGVQLFALPWSLVSLGVAGALSIYAISAAGASVALFASASLLPALAGRFCHSCLVYNIASPVLTLAGGALPLELSDRVGMLSVGWVDRSTTVVLSLILLALPSGGASPILGFLGAVLGLGLLASLVPLRGLYAQSVIELLKGGLGQRSRIVTIDPALLPVEVITVLGPCLRSADPDMASMAIDVLVSCRSAPALGRLAVFLDSDAPVTLKVRIFRSLVGRDKPGAPPRWTRSAEEQNLIEKGLRASEPETIAAAVDALGCRDGYQARERIAPYLDHPEPAVRAAAAAHFGRTAPTEAETEERLGQMLASPEAALVRAGLEALADREAGCALRIVGRYLVHPDPEVRRLALRAVTRAAGTDPDRRIGIAREGLADSSRIVRLEAVEALGFLASGDAFAALALALDDSSRAVRRSAAQLLLKYGNASLGPLARAARDNRSSHDRRHGALQLLAELGQYRPVLELGREEVVGAFQLIGVRAALEGESGASAAARLFDWALEERIRFRGLLGIHAICLSKRSHEIFPLLEHRLGSSEARLRSGAVEAVINLEERELTPHALQLFERRADREQLRYARVELDVEEPDREGAAAVIYGENDPFLLSAWLELLRERGWDEVFDRCPSYAMHPHILVQESYRAASRWRKDRLAC